MSRSERGLSRRGFIYRAGGLAALVGSGAIGSVLSACSGAAPAPAKAEPTPEKLTGPVRWMTWSGDAEQGNTSSFEKKYGVAIQFTPMNDDAEAYGKLKTAGAGGFDVIAVDGLWPKRYHADGFIEPLDMAEFATTAELLPFFKNYPSWVTSDGKMLTFPMSAAASPIIYDADFVKPAPDSFEVFFDPKYKGRVALRNSADRVFAITASLLGYKFEYGDYWDLQPQEFERCKQELIRGKPNFKMLWTSSGELVKAMASGEIKLGLASAHGVALRARDAGVKTMRTVTPKEKTVGYVDGLMLVNNATNKAAAKLWIDHYLSADQALIRFEKVWRASVNQKMIELAIKQGHEEEVNLLHLRDAEQEARNFSDFRPFKSTNLLDKAWAEFLAA